MGSKSLIDTLLFALISIPRVSLSWNSQTQEESSFHAYSPFLPVLLRTFPRDKKMRNSLEKKEKLQGGKNPASKSGWYKKSLGYQILKLFQEKKKPLLRMQL